MGPNIIAKHVIVKDYTSLPTRLAIAQEGTRSDSGNASKNAVMESYSYFNVMMEITKTAMDVPLPAIYSTVTGAIKALPTAPASVPFKEH